MLAERDENSQATCATCPKHFWLEYVVLAGKKLGAAPEISRELAVKSRLARAYFAGEPVWMAAEMLGQISSARGKNSPDAREELRRAASAFLRTR